MNPGLPKTSDRLETFAKYLYTIEGYSYQQIADYIGVAIGTVHNIATRRGFAGKRGKPQGIEESLGVLDDMLTQSLHKANEYMQNEVTVDKSNFHRHVRSLCEMIIARKGIVESRAYDSLKAAMQAMKDFEKWLSTTEALPQEICEHTLIALTTFQEQRTQESLAILQGIAQK